MLMRIGRWHSSAGDVERGAERGNRRCWHSVFLYFVVVPFCSFFFTPVLILCWELFTLSLTVCLHFFSSSQGHTAAELIHRDAGSEGKRGQHLYLNHSPPRSQSLICILKYFHNTVLNTVQQQHSSSVPLFPALFFYSQGFGPVQPWPLTHCPPLILPLPSPLLPLPCPTTAASSVSGRPPIGQTLLNARLQ